MSNLKKHNCYIDIYCNLNKDSSITDLNEKKNCNKISEIKIEINAIHDYKKSKGRRGWTEKETQLLIYSNKIFKGDLSGINFILPDYNYKEIYKKLNLLKQIENIKKSETANFDDKISKDEIDISSYNNFFKKLTSIEIMNECNIDNFSNKIKFNSKMSLETIIFSDKIIKNSFDSIKSKNFIPLLSSENNISNENIFQN